MHIRRRERRKMVREPTRKTRPTALHAKPIISADCDIIESFL